MDQVQTTSVAEYDKAVEQGGADKAMGYTPEQSANIFPPQLPSDNPDQTDVSPTDVPNTNTQQIFENNAQDQKTPFDFQDTEVNDQTTKPNPITTQVMTMALVGQNVTDQSDVAQSILAARDFAEKAVGTQAEQKLRAETAINRVNFTLNAPDYVNSPEHRQADAVQAQIATSNLQQQMHTALEKEAIDQIQNLAAAGDTTQARIIMHRVNPTTANLSSLWHDNLVKSLMLAQLQEKFKQDDDKEGWLSAAYTGLISMVQPSVAPYLGNVDNGVGGFVQKGFLDRIFHSGSDMQRQAQAIWGMTPEDLADYLPQLEANIRSNSRYLGVENPDKAVELAGMFQNPLSDQAASDLTYGNDLDMALFVAPGVGVVPYKLATKGLSISFTMLRAGARKEAAAAAATAIETAAREGADTAFEKTGTTVDQAMDEAMPSIINPEVTEPRMNVSMNNEVNHVSEQAQQLLKEWEPRNDTERFANPAEARAAAEARLADIETRYGVPAIDYKVTPQVLSDGTHTNVLEVTFGNPRGGLFATEQEASAWRTSAGFGDGTVKEVAAPELIEEAVRPAPTFTDKLRAAGSRWIDREFQAQRSVTATAEDITSREIANDPGAEVALTPKEAKILDKAWDRGWNKLDDIQKQYYKKNPQEVIALREQIINQMLASKEAAALMKSVESPAVKIAKSGRRLKAVTPANDVIVQDPSGGFANVIHVDIPETGFYTELNTPQQGATSRFLKNISQTSDKNLYGKGLIADQKANRLYQKIGRTMKDAYGPLKKDEKVWFQQVVAYQANEKRWLEPAEIEGLLERAMGKAPRRELVDAINMHHVLNDAEFAFRNDGVYRDKVIRGFESVQFSAHGQPFDIDGKISYQPTIAPRSRVYDISNDIHYVGDKKLTNERVKELSAQGYIIVKTEKPLKLADGTMIDTFIGKKGDFLVNRLRREQLGYYPGGHRIYESKYQVKQGSFIKQPDTGSKTLGSPNTFVMAENIRDARRWAARMNEARLAVKEGEDAAFLDANIFRGEKGFPSGEDFVDQVEKGLVDKNLPFEALYDRELPSAYKGPDVDLEAILGEGEPSGINGYFRTTGRMYYSKKGDHLLDTLGDPAPTMDPIKAQAQALFNVTRLSASFGDFKVSAMERWVNKYRPYLDIREGLNREDARSSVAIFNKANPKEGIDFNLKQQMLGQRESVRRILGFETDLDRNYRHWMRSTAEWIIGDSDSKFRKSLSEGVFWIYHHNPVTFLRGLAFDSKLGLLNIGQFFIQTSTMASALALNPKYGKFGLASAFPTWAFFLSKGNENVLETLARRGVWKLGGFADAAEWKTYIREAQRSGFFDLGASHTMVNDLGPERFASSIRSGVQQTREMARWWFYQAEVMNRLVSHRIAYGEALEKFGKADWDNHLFQEFIARRSENYSFNMSNGSKSWWQTGLMSIPTQFWAYNVRMIEALTGKNFTIPQKLRLLGMQFALAGTAGIPIVDAVQQAVKEHYGVEPKIDTAAGVASRGIADYMVYEMFGADVNIGDRWGTGSWSTDLVRNIFGYSRYNEQTFADIAGGSTYSITSSVLGPLLGSAYNVATYWMTHESGAEDVNLTGDQVMSMFRQISTVNHTLQAWEIYNYGLFRSSSGKIIADQIPTSDAVFAAMGFAPNEMNQLSVMMDYQKNRQEMIKDAANQIAEWREEALTRPDLLQTNAKKVNAFVKFLPVEIKHDVLARAHDRVKPSIYASIKEKYDKTRQAEQLARQLNEEQK